jgi:hypothetical protein
LHLITLKIQNWRSSFTLRFATFMFNEVLGDES